ncbi:MAG: carboxypeptidase regulatory-like domain-containing protein [Vulcanimicrobiaceae bacterium]
MLILLVLGALSATARPVLAAEATTGAIIGSVSDASGKPVAGARIAAASPSGTYSATTDARGRFSILGVVSDTYTISAEAPGFQSVTQGGVTVLPNGRQQAAFTLRPELPTIGHVSASTSAFSVGAPSDDFTISGATARAQSPPVSSSGLANYLSNTVQGAVASVPGVVLDEFANAILRGGKVSDAIFDYDSVPIPQGLVAEPGGNIVGAQLPTTGVASTSVTLAGYTSQGNNALGGVIDQIPAVGTYPGSATLDTAYGLAGGKYREDSLQILGATPDLRLRYALAATAGSQYFSYGDGRTFYPAEAGTYGLAIQSRGDYSLESNVHYKLGSKDDVSLLVLAGQATYNQYGSPYSGETVGEFDGTNPSTGAPVTYPGETNANAAVNYASGIRGTYSILKAQWLHSGAHSLSRVQLYQSQVGSSAGGPFWDENGWPDGTISLSQQQGAREEGLGYDGEDLLGDRHDLRFGAEYRTNTSFLQQVVPTAGEFISSRPTLISYLAYLNDSWRITPHLELAGTARLTDTHIIPSNGSIYDVGALDPHIAAAYRLGNNLALRATYDHITVAPLPLEADRTDSTNVDQNGNPAPFVQLAPETANNLTYSLEGGGRTQFRLTYFLNNDQNLIDVLPYNFRSAVASGLNPNGVGVPTNVGDLRARGTELWLHNGGFTLDADYIRAYSSSASQLAYNDLNAAAVAAGHLFPVSYLPNFSATLAWEYDTPGKHLRITPSLSFESGYPYGNGKEIWIFDPVTNKPVQVPNDNYYNPGYNYYFLANPAEPFNAASNPYIASLGTPEGNDPNTLHAPPQTIVNLHVEGDLSPRLTAILDLVNLFGNFSPSAYQGNPYLIGPPGYTGGNPAYSAAYQAAGGYSQPYTLGNGVPTNDGVAQSVPWTYGTGGYVPQSYPLGRSVQLRLRYRI